MKEMYSGEQAKAIDTHAIDTMGMPSLVLMEKAAMSVVSVLLEKAVQAPIVQQKGEGAFVRQIKQQRIPGFVFVAAFRHPVKNCLRNLLRMGAGKRAGQDHEQNQRGERSFHHKNPLIPFFHRTNGHGISFRISKQKRPA